MSDLVRIVSISCLVIGGVSALVIAIDLLAGHKQHMWIMNLVWPVTALYAGPLALWGYFTAGRLLTHRAMMETKARGEGPHGKKKPFWQMVAVGATHSGSGCTLADIVGEWALFLFPLTLFGIKIVARGWWTTSPRCSSGFSFNTLRSRRCAASRSARHGRSGESRLLFAHRLAGGVYGWMAVATFVIFGHELEKTNPVFWFMMQIAMLAGFLTADPVNWCLLRAGIKEKM